MTEHKDGDTGEHMSDDDLVDRESTQRRAYLRLERREPHLRDTTYRALNASRTLMRAWERWSRTSLAMRLRGLRSHDT